MRREWPDDLAPAGVGWQVPSGANAGREAPYEVAKTLTRRSKKAWEQGISE
jgi:hypothetical protein